MVFTYILLDQLPSPYPFCITYRKVQFEYESSPVFLTIQELKDGLKLYDEFVAKLPLQRSLRMREEKRTPHEEESTENVLLNTKRTRANVDYVALSMQVSLVMRN